MKSIASCVEPAPPTYPGADVIDVAARFANNPGLRALAVEQDGEIVALVYREAVEAASRHSRAGQTVQDLMTPDVLSLPSSVDPRDALNHLLSDPLRREAFVVMDDGHYAGMCGLRTLASALLAAASPAEGMAEQFNLLVRVAENEYRGHVHGLLAMAERLGRQNLGPDGRAQVDSIKATGAALLRLADDTLDLMKTRDGKLVLDPHVQLLRELIDDVQDRWSTRAAEAGVGLLISYDGDPDLSAMIDKARLTQVFDNLIDNALNQTRHGSVEVSLLARRNLDQVMLEGRVRDTGPGLPADKLARIFELDSNETAQAGSLPLSLARGIVLAMNGSIRAESNMGQGLTIVFDMMADPAVKDEKADTQSVSGPAPHVLVVDDNATNRMVAEALCEMFGCSCETVVDGVEAVDAARSARFDLILMDIKMPRMDGVGAARAIRGLGGGAGATPIIALTANADPEDVRRYLAVGMCDVVEKPIKPERLLKAINQALAASGAALDMAAVAAA